MRQLLLLVGVVVSALSFASAQDVELHSLGADLWERRVEDEWEETRPSDVQLLELLRSGKAIQAAAACDPDDRKVGRKNPAFGFPWLVKVCLRSKAATPEDMAILIRLAEERTPTLGRPIVNTLRRKIPFAEAPAAERAIAEGKWEVVSGLARHFVSFGKSDVERIFREGGPGKGGRFAKAVGAERAFATFFTGDVGRFRNMIEAVNANPETAEWIRACVPDGGFSQITGAWGGGRSIWEVLRDDYPGDYLDAIRLGLLQVLERDLVTLVDCGKDTLLGAVIEQSEPARRIIEERLLTGTTNPNVQAFVAHVPRSVRGNVLTDDALERVRDSFDAASRTWLVEEGWIPKKVEDAWFNAWAENHFALCDNVQDWFGEAPQLEVERKWPGCEAAFREKRRQAGIAWIREHADELTLEDVAALAEYGEDALLGEVLGQSETARKAVAKEIVENPEAPTGRLFLERVPENVRVEVLPKAEILKVALKQGGERLEALRQTGWVSEADFREADDARYEAWVKQRLGNYSDATDWFEPHGRVALDLQEVRERWPGCEEDFQARRRAAGLAWLRKHGPYTYDNIMWELRRNAVAIAEAKLAVMPQEMPCPADVLARLILKAPESALLPALIARCTDLNAAKGVTPLIAAVGVGKPELIKALVAHGANPRQKVRAGALGSGLLGGLTGNGLPGVDAGVGGVLAMGFEARLSGMDFSDEETLEIYLREGGWRHLASTAAGLVADALTQRGPTALEQAACVKKPGLIEAFLESGATIDREAAINTPLAYACAVGNADAIRALLKAGGKANCFVSLGEGRSGAALSYAVLTVEDQDLVRQLAEVGAGVSDEAVYCARMKGWDALADWLKTKVDPHYYSDYGIAAKAMKKELLLGEEEALRLLRNLHVTEETKVEE